MTENLHIHERKLQTTKFPAEDVQWVISSMVLETGVGVNNQY